MFSGILRLLVISAITLILTFLVVFFVRWVGGQQTFSEPPHPWFKISKWQLADLSSEDLCLNHTVPSSVTPDRIVPVTVERYEGGWAIACQSHQTLSSLLKISKHPNWLIIVKAHDTAGLDSLAKEIAAFNADKNFGIYSASQPVARDLRKKGPEWLFAADSASLLRFHVYASFWIETAFDFWPDFVLRSATDKNSHLSSREEAELHRRKKRVIDTR